MAENRETTTPYTSPCSPLYSVIQSTSICFRVLERAVGKFCSYNCFSLFNFSHNFNSASALCNECAHTVELDIARLVERDGVDYPVPVLKKRLKCTRCGSASVECRWHYQRPRYNAPVGQSLSARKALRRIAPGTRLKLRRLGSPQFLGVGRGTGRCLSTG